MTRLQILPGRAIYCRGDYSYCYFKMIASDDQLSESWYYNLLNL